MTLTNRPAATCEDRIGEHQKPRRLVGACCPGAKGDTEVIELRTGTPHRLPLHFRRLVEPSLHTIEVMVEALNDVFEQSGVSVHAEVRSNRTLELPDLEVVDFPPGECPESIALQPEGLCLISGDCEDEDQLYGNRDEVPDDEICFYIVTDINKPCDPIGRANIDGCAWRITSLYHEACSFPIL